MIARDGENVVGETWRGARLEWEDNKAAFSVRGWTKT